MERHFLKLLATVFAVLAVSLFATHLAKSQGPAANHYQMVIDADAHQRFGLYYPVTYHFQIPSGLSNLTAEYRYTSSGSWQPLLVKTASEFFNGENAVRFDYSGRAAYISVAFSMDSHAIYVRVLNGATEIPIAFVEMPVYYDNRQSAATVSLDDWGALSSEWNAASQILTNAHVHYTVGIVSGGYPDWNSIQNWYNQGFLEPAGHSRTHPCTDPDYQANHGFDWQIAGIRDDIFANLSLDPPYVPAFIDPCGFTSASVRQAVVAANYLANRGAEPGPAAFSDWGMDGSYERAMYTYSSQVWQGNGTPTRRDEANASFDSAHAAGGIYHLMDHPGDGLWASGSYLAQHINHIANRLDVWYAAFGELYLYHFVQERGLVSVTPEGAPLPTYTPTPTPTSGGEVVNPADLMALPLGTHVLINFNNFPNRQDGVPIPAWIGGCTWSSIVEGSPWAGFFTWNAYLARGSSQGTVTFPRHVLVTSLRVSSNANNTITLSSTGNSNASLTTTGGNPQTLTTGWATSITSLTIHSSSQDHVLDDLRLTIAPGPDSIGQVNLTATARNRQAVFLLGATVGLLLIIGMMVYSFSSKKEIP